MQSIEGIEGSDGTGSLILFTDTGTGTKAPAVSYVCIPVPVHDAVDFPHVLGSNHTKMGRIMKTATVLPSCRCNQLAAGQD